MTFVLKLMVNCAISYKKRKIKAMRIAYRPILFTGSLLWLVFPEIAQAGGFGIAAQSGSAIGNAFAGAASAEDVSTVWYNPAGLTRLDGTNVSAAAHVIETSFKFENGGSTGAFAQPGSGDGGNGGGLALVPQLYASARVSDKLSLGMAFNTPFGLKTEYDAGWRGQFTALKSEAKSYNLNPAIAYKVNNSLSLGGGVDWQRFTADLTNYAGPLGFAELKATDNGWGFNVGAMLTMSNGTRMGASYRSSISYKLTGSADFTSGGGIYNSNVQAKLRVPENASINLLSPMSKQWELMLNATWTRWSRLQTLAILRTSPSAIGASGSVVTAIPFDWTDTVMIAAGANYNVRPNWKLRVGIAYDPAASGNATRTPRLPDQSRLLLGLGARLQLSSKATFDLGYAHDFIKDAAINTTAVGVPGSLIGQFKDTANVISAQYNLQL